MTRRATTQEELLASILRSRAALDNKFSKLNPMQMVWTGSMGEWSVKDILAHIVDWEQRFVGWYEAGLRGEIPETPEPGYRWKDLPRLNQAGYEGHKEDPLSRIMAEYGSSHRQIVALVESMTEEEIFTPGTYAWTGKDPLLIWIAANTSSHYAWAKRNIRTTLILKAFSGETVR